MWKNKKRILLVFLVAAVLLSGCTAEKKEVLEKLRPLQKVQRSVDLVMMEIEDQPDPENLLAEEKTACRDQIQKKDRVKKKSYGVEL